MANGWNGGRKRPGGDRAGAQDDATRAMPAPGSARPRAWSQVPQQARQAPPQQSRPPLQPTQHQPIQHQPTQHWDRSGIDRTQYAPTQTPQPYRGDGRFRDGPPPRRVPEPRPRPPAAPRRRPRWGRRLGIVLLVLLLVVGGFVLYLDRSMNRTEALVDYAGRPADTPGTNWLLVGSDSRADLSPEEQAALATGDAGGNRTDTIMLLHVSDAGDPTTMVSIPRDSYLPIPGNGDNKVNAAFSLGGAPLLVQTVEQATGIRVDHYAEVGFGGFAGVVDAVGGVDLCVPEAITDPLAGLDVQAGCQTLDGATALGYVRTRVGPTADLARVQRQREFLSALLDKATSPGTLANPLRALPLATKGVGSLTVDSGDHLWNLVGLGLAMRSDLVTTTVPVGGFADMRGIGNVVLWDDARAPQFFGALVADQPIPTELLTAGP